MKKTKKKPKPFPLNAYIFGALRKIYRWHPERKKALDRQKRAEDKYECEECHKLFSRKKRQIHVDHIEPVVDPKTGFVSWDEYIKRLFVTADKLQILCKKDHKKKTKKENKQRRRNG